jgi:lysophospholipase L1-like esterase
MDKLVTKPQRGDIIDFDDVKLINILQFVLNFAHMYWYNQDIEWLEKKEITSTKLKKAVFLGSSTFTLWSSLENDFDKFNAVNLGFGGSTLAACTWFFDRLVPRHKPDALFIYAGDNDLGDGRSPEEVVLFYYQLIANIRKTLGNIPICYLSIKISPQRAHLKGSIEYTNACIQDYVNKNAKKESLHFIDIYHDMFVEDGNINTELFEEDGLHLSSKGYSIFIDKINKQFEEIFKI